MVVVVGFGAGTGQFGGSSWVLRGGWTGLEQGLGRLGW